MLHLTRDFPPCANGGISQAVGDLVRHLKNRYTESFVISFDAWKPHKRVSRGNRCLVDTSEPSKLEPWLFRLHDKSQLEAARKFAIESGAQVVHVHDAALWDEAEAMASELKAETIYTVHVYHREMNLIRGLKRTAGSEAEKKAFARASVVSVPCKSMKNLLARDFPWLRAKLREASWGTDVIGKHVELDTKEVIYAGRFSDIKGTDLLGKIVPQVLGRVRDARFILAGGVPFNPRAEKKWIESIISTLDESCSKRFQATGWLDAADLHTRLGNTWVMISPGKFETFGLSVLSAMSQSVAVVAARSPGVESLLRHGKNGYLVEPNDTDAMVEYLVKVLSCKNLRDDLGKNGRESVKKNWLWQSRIRDWLEIYDELARDRAY